MLIADIGADQATQQPEDDAMGENNDGFGENTENWFAESPDYAKSTKTLTVSAEIVEWLDALKQNGLLRDTPTGGIALTPGVNPVLKAVHVVLAGGKVSVQVDEQPDEKISQSLDAKLDKALVAMMRTANK